MNVDNMIKSYCPISERINMKNIFSIFMIFISFAISGKTLSMDTPYQGSKGDAFPSARNVHGKKLFVFDPREHAWAAYNAEGYLIASGEASGGADYCADVGRVCRTVTGSFRVYRKQGAECVSSVFPIREGEDDGGAPMPYCMHFYRGYAIHGSSNVPNKNVSHGCIRVKPSAAEWLNQNFIEIGTPVLVLPYSVVGRLFWNALDKFDALLM